MEIFKVFRQQIAVAVPFARHVGVELVHIGDGSGEARLKQSATNLNHIGTMHAGAIFTLGEAASGAAMAGALAPVLMNVRPVASQGRIEFLKPARGTITATGKTSFASAELLTELEAKGRTSFEVNVGLHNEDAELVATMVIEWNVKSIIKP